MKFYKRLLSIVLALVLIGDFVPMLETDAEAHSSEDAVSVRDGIVLQAQNNLTEVKVHWHDNFSGTNYLNGTDFVTNKIVTSRDTSVCNVYIDSNEKVFGTNSENSLKIVFSSAGESGKDLAIETETNGSTSKNSYIGDNKEMWLSFYAKATTSDSKMYFRWGHESESRSITLQQSWRAYLVKMNKTEDFGAFIHSYVDKPGTVWLCRMQLTDSRGSDFKPENGSIQHTTCRVSGTYTLPEAPEREGYRFDGWYTSKSGGEKITSSTQVKPGHIKLYAHWTHVHTWDSGRVTKPATCTEEGEETYYCIETYSHRMVKPIPPIGHNYGTATYLNSEYHQKVCQNNSEHKVEQSHQWDGGKITKQATEASTGIRKYTCTVCKGTKDEVIPKPGSSGHVHSLVKTNAKAATCTTAGNKAYWTCSGCKKVFSDSSATKETTASKMKIAATGHSYVSWKYYDEAYHQQICSNNSSHIRTEKHSWDSGTITKKPTETTTGIKTFKCSTCKGTKTEMISPLKHTHSLKKTAAVAATCTKSGNKAYWTCSSCQMVFSDSKGKNAVTVASMTIVAKGHSYGDWSKYNSEKHKRVCGRSSSHIEYQNHIWDSGTITKAATTSSVGTMTYKCKSCTATRKEEIPKIKAKTVLRRLYGENRYDTSIAIAKAYKTDSKQTKFNSIIVARGDAFPDALSASSLAKKLKAPVLVWREKENAKIQAYIKQNVKKGGRVYLLGGTPVLPDSIKSGLKDYSFTRLGGQNRFETNIKILKKSGAKGGIVLVCNGLEFEEALIASATGYPVLLINKDKPGLRPEQTEFLSSLIDAQFEIIGTETSVPKSIATELAHYGSVHRILGRTTDQISYNVAKTLYDVKQTEITLAVNTAYPDGLCGGPICIQNKGPLFLINNNSYSYAKNYCKGMNLTRINILGGPTLISDVVAKDIGEVK